MQVGELYDAVSVERFGQPLAGDGSVVVYRMLACIESPVEHAAHDIQGQNQACYMSPVTVPFVPQAREVVGQGEYRVEPLGHIHQKEGVEYPHGCVDVECPSELELKENSYEYGSEHDTCEAPPQYFHPPRLAPQVSPVDIGVGRECEYGE